jgi:hypothetical protein
MPVTMAMMMAVMAAMMVMAVTVGMIVVAAIVVVPVAVVMVMPMTMAPVVVAVVARVISWMSHGRSGKHYTGRCSGHQQPATYQVRHRLAPCASGVISSESRQQALNRA